MESLGSSGQFQTSGAATSDGASIGADSLQKKKNGQVVGDQ